MIMTVVVPQLRSKRCYPANRIFLFRFSRQHCDTGSCNECTRCRNLIVTTEIIMSCFFYTNRNLSFIKKRTIAWVSKREKLLLNKLSTLEVIPIIITNVGRNKRLGRRSNLSSVCQEKRWGKATFKDYHNWKKSFKAKKIENPRWKCEKERDYSDGKIRKKETWL